MQIMSRDTERILGKLNRLARGDAGLVHRAIKHAEQWDESGQYTRALLDDVVAYIEAHRA